MDKKESFPDTSLEDWEKELNEEVASFQDILADETPSQKELLSSSFQEKLESFIKSKSKTLGEEIVSDCRELFSKADKQTQTYLKMLENLTRALLKFENLSELFTNMTNKLPLILSSETQSLEKENLIRDFYKQYQDLKTRSPSPTFSETPSERPKEIKVLTEKIIETVEAKLHEINIKIEENQRILQRLIARSENIPSTEETPITLPETSETEEIEEVPFYLISIGEERFALPAEVVINVYKISSKKAKKLVQKPLIKFGQIGSFFNPITKGLTGELKEKKKGELENMFLNVLQPETDTEGEYHAAVVVKIPDMENYGVIFVNQSLKEVIKGRKMEDKIETSEGNFPALDVKSLWLKKQVEFGLI